MDINKYLEDNSGFLCENGEFGPATLEFSKVLKEIGFNKKVRAYWLDKELPHTKKGLRISTKREAFINHNAFDEFIYSAPTKEEVTNWLKTKKYEKFI